MLPLNSFRYKFYPYVEKGKDGQNMREKIIENNDLHHIDRSYPVFRESDMNYCTTNAVSSCSDVIEARYSYRGGRVDVNKVIRPILGLKPIS